MTKRQNSHTSASPPALSTLITVINRSVTQDITLDDFLAAWIQSIITTWPTIKCVTIYIQGASGLERRAAHGVPDGTPVSPLPDSPAMRAISQRHMIESSAEAEFTRWGVPLLDGQNILGAMQIDLLTEPDLHTSVGETLDRLQPILGLAIGRLLHQPALMAKAPDPQAKALKPILTALYQIARQLSMHTASAETLNAICRSLTLTPGLIYAAVSTTDPTAITQQVRAEHPVRLTKQHSTVMLDNALNTYVQEHPTPTLLRSRETIAGILGDHYAQIQTLPIEALLIAPLRAQNTIVGVLLLATADADSTFSPAEVYVAEAIATQIALSLRNTDLYRSIQHRANQLEQTTAFGRLVTSTFKETEILQHVAEIVPNLFECEYISVALYTNGQTQMRIFDLKQHIRPNASNVSAGGSSVEDVVRSQTPLLIPDLQRSTYTDHKRVAQRDLHAMITVPLIASQHTLGTLSIATRKSDVYTPTDLTLLQQIGTQVAIALENAYLFQSAQQRAVYEESLSEITSRLQQQSDLRIILEQTMHDLGTVLGATRARVQLRLIQSDDTSSSKE